MSSAYDKRFKIKLTEKCGFSQEDCYAFSLTYAHLKGSGLNSIDFCPSAFV